ncbi:DUF1232 domain-containing protein [Acidobacteriota bacterium]
MKGILVFLLAIASVLYLLNIGAGVFEIIPDNIPFVGNLDEAGAIALLIMCLRYFGFDVAGLFDRTKKTKKIDNQKPDKQIEGD